jgi:membrane fusion protein (multidrug efflux system)
MKMTKRLAHVVKVGGWQLAGMTAVLVLAACGKQEQQGQMPAPEVAVQTVDRTPVPLDLTYAARTTGSREVEVRARVGGILLKRRFQEGTRVKEGQSLFQIDPEPVRARAASARADVSVARARLDEARRQRDRVLPLFDQNAVSQSRRDEAVSGFEVAQANLESAQSALKTAELDLGYTDVRAPIAGLTSREMMSEGSLVSMNQDASLLTRIVQVDPLYIEFAVPESEASLIRASLASKTQPVVKLVLENGETYRDAAKLNFVDTSVDQQSGTVLLRATLANPQGELLPGQFIRAKVEGVALANVVSIPRKALVSNAQGNAVWIIDGDSKAQMRPVQIGRSMGNNIIVTNGLNPGERYIVDGVIKVQMPGMPVNAVSIDSASQQAENQAQRKDPA